MSTPATGTRTASLKMSIAGRPIEMEIAVPEGPAKPRQLLPLLQWVTDEVVGIACAQVAQQGKKISCQAGCGACCRQLVPISQAEAYRVAELVEKLSEPRRSVVRRRFQTAHERLAAAGLLEQLSERKSLPEEAAHAIGMDYFRLGIPCPFLEDESCSIHPDRPLVCREYLVTSPAENCRQPTAETIERVAMPVKVANALLRLERGGAEGVVPWVPLVLAPHWVESHPDTEPRHTGPELVREIFERIADRELPPHDNAEQAQTTGEHAPAHLPIDDQGVAPRRTDGATERGRPTIAADVSHAERQASSYDEVPYDSRPFPFTHPDSLATIAMLFGMTPPAIERCRVLELGCAEGGNLIPMALGLPEGRFLGLDLSPRQIADGQGHVEQLALRNIDLRVMDLMEVDHSFGEFDFIICHGVFSWVPRAVQDKILAIFSEHLAPQGVAYVSYNTYPGWYSRGVVREMVRYHVDPAAPARERVRQAREFLGFLARNTRDPTAVYTTVLQEELDLWAKESDSYVLHEQLGDNNDPLYFHQFALRLADHRLQYIGEVKLSDNAAMASDEVREKLVGYRDDLVRYEQYLDFLRQRTFRRSLLCHEQVPLNRSPRTELIEAFLLAARAEPIAPVPEHETSPTQRFRTHDGISFSTNNPWLKAALSRLFACWPRQLSFEELCRQARLELGESPDARLDPLADPALLKQPLLQCGMMGLVELHVHRSPGVTEVSDRPRASALAQLQARTSRLVTNLRHRQLELSECDRQLLLRLDGRHTHDDLLQTMAAMQESGELDFRSGMSEGADTTFNTLSEWLTETLRRFVARGLLDG